MSTRKYFKYLALLSLASGISAPLAFPAPQDELLNHAFAEPMQHYRDTWDSIHRDLIFMRDTTIQDASIHVYSGSATPVSISPTSDFPGASLFTFWDASGGPQGAVVVSCTVMYGTNKGKNLVITYDSNGKLTKVWDVYPYHFLRIAVDKQGDVYGFGARTDKGNDDSDGDYALMIAYSPQGRVIWESLPRSSFAWGSDVMSGSRNQSDNQLLVSGQGILLYVAATEEFFRFDLSGRLTGRFPLKPVLAAIAGSPNVFGHLMNATVTTSDRTVATVQVWAKTVTSKLVEIEPDFINWRELSPAIPGARTARLEGMWDEGTLLFLIRDNRGIISLAKTYMP